MAEDNSREYRNLIEAVLFVSGKAMSAEEIASAIGVSSVGAVRTMIAALAEEYTKSGGALAVEKVADTYMLSVREPYASKVSGLAGSPDITRGSLRVLAYISRNEPILQSAVVRVFGSSTYDHVKELSEKDFIRSTKIGRSKRLETTKKFREYFSLSK
ncbi:MAG: SMC-Scp complex subunit ScpB [Candidatus Marsarchaeota archaeon]|nr:SMC-Scp complex subunit ScpB [Candidatus Marsarchaeota archaeon]MCL5007064.1 SMC-Scp complex subunit ScpB [Candidatus Marsarchaeota archaeon]MCL5430914.1 SMC-Scp complex subunit ScpB [Candidatus Marsarchaeota archaeon]